MCENFKSFGQIFVSVNVLNIGHMDQLQYHNSSSTKIVPAAKNQIA